MKLLKQLLTYLIWTSLSLLLGIGYMRIVLGSNNTSKDGLGYLFHLFYSWGLFHVGLVVGLVIAFLFILVDFFYLKKRFKKKDKLIIVRFGSLLTLTIVVAAIHYILEKVIDVI